MKKICILRMLICISVVMVMLRISVKAEARSIQVEDVNVISESKDEVLEENKKEADKVYEMVEKMKDNNEILRELDVEEFVEGLNDKDGFDLEKNKIIRAAKKVLLKEIAETGKLMGVIVVIAIVCSLLKHLQDAFKENRVSDIAYFTCFASMIVVISKSFYISISIASNAVNGISDFMYAIVPVMIVLFASIGNVTQAIFMDPILIASINICITIISKVIFPMITLSFVLSFVNNLSEDYKIGRLSSIIKSSVLWIQGTMMTIFVTILTIRSIASATMDDVTIKAAKFAVDSAVPVVGKTLSDAISTMAGYTLLLKNSIGTLGMVVIILVMLSPIIKLFCISGIYKVTGALLQPISDKRLTDSIDSVGNCITLILACVICTTVMTFIMVAVLTATGKGIISV